MKLIYNELDGVRTQIFNHLKEIYSDASIFYNEKIKGKNSKQFRQIDVLIESYVAGKRIRIITDTKYFKNKIDVKDVESFASMVQDVEAQQGILITNIGYTKAAINTAYNGPTDIELDIINFDNLKQFQAHETIVRANIFGAYIQAPFGWVVDGKSNENVLATFYQRGLDFTGALKNDEWMYVNLFVKENDINSLDDLLKYQEIGTKINFPNVKFEYDRSITRPDGAKTALRTLITNFIPQMSIQALLSLTNSFYFLCCFRPLN